MNEKEETQRTNTWNLEDRPFGWSEVPPRTSGLKFLAYVLVQYSETYAWMCSS
jgi:hypothetical protein